LETDVHASADGVLVVCHDPTLERVAGQPVTIGDLPWRQLKQARVAGTEVLPRLDELLACWPHARFNIDAKDDAALLPLAQLLVTNRLMERVCVTSFSDRRLNWLRRHLGPGLCTAAGPLQVANLRLASLLPAAGRRGRPRGRRGAHAVQVPLRWGAVPVVDRRLVTAAHRAGLAVHVWTIDDTRAMEVLLDMGVDGIMTDHPTRLRAVLEGRGRWV
ncbi:MAG TPA: glycerophosphodiester phosphodiesterase family protein, partial [Acidimicrobiales bacterium]|nr:glycerophosphodiester phosphodiesterase family protein [Acidimicrobiales bacterium]